MEVLLRLICVLSLLTSSACHAASPWPQWRGPKRDGHSPDKGLLQSWPAAGPTLLWKTNGIGRGYSSVSLGGPRLFTMGDSPDSSMIHALDKDTGKLVWAAKVGRPGGDYPGTRSTPTFDDDSVYALGQHGDLVAVEAATGTERWRKNLQKDFGGKMMSGWGYSESVLVDGDKVVCTPGGSKGTVVALAKKNGALVWQSKDITDSAAYCSLVPAELGGVKQYVQMTDKSVFGIAAQDGKLLWRAARRGETAVIPTPIVRDDTVYVTSGYNVGCNLFKITRSGDSFQAQEVYSNKVMANHHGGVVLVGDYIYGHSDRAWTCQELKTGREVWTERSKLGKGSITYADGHLYLRSESGQGTVVLIEASPEGWKQKGQFAQPHRSKNESWPHPVVADGRLYLRDQDVLLCYDVKGK